MPSPLTFQRATVPTEVVTQLSDAWYELIGSAQLADAILDRIVHNAYKVALTGESMRKRNAQLTEEAH